MSSAPAARSASTSGPKPGSSGTSAAIARSVASSPSTSSHWSRMHSRLSISPRSNCSCSPTTRARPGQHVHADVGGGDGAVEVEEHRRARDRVERCHRGEVSRDPPRRVRMIPDCRSRGAAMSSDDNVKTVQSCTRLRPRRLPILDASPTTSTGPPRPCGTEQVTTSCSSAHRTASSPAGDRRRRHVLTRRALPGAGRGATGTRGRRWSCTTTGGSATARSRCYRGAEDTLQTLRTLQ